MDLNQLFNSTFLGKDMDTVNDVNQLKKTGEKRLTQLKIELARIVENATEQQKRCYLGETDDNSVPYYKLIDFREKQIEAMKISLGLKNLMNK